MKISTKGRYAVLAMVELAINDKKGLLPLADLSLSKEISVSYLEQLFSHLRSKDLVTGVRGPKGGYRIARAANEISIAEIVSAVDIKADPNNQPLAIGTNDSREATHNAWIVLSKQMYKFLDGITLSEITDAPELLDNASATQQNNNEDASALYTATEEQPRIACN